MYKKELDEYLEENEYLKRMKEGWEEEKLELIQKMNLPNQAEEEEARSKLNEVWIGWRSVSSLPSDEAAWGPKVRPHIQSELNNAMENNQCNAIRTVNYHYYLTADEEGNNTLYVDSRWLKENIRSTSTREDYLREIKNIVGKNEDFKITDMEGEFENESVKDFLYKAEMEYGIKGGSNPPQLTPPSTTTGN